MLFLAFFFYSSPSWSVSAKYLTLSDAIALALRYNPTVKSGEIQRIADKFALRVEQYNYELQYQITSSITYTNIMSNNVRSESDATTLTPQATILLPTGAQATLSTGHPLSHTAGQARFYNPAVTFNITQPLLKGAGPTVTLAPLYNAEDQELINQLTLKSTLISTITTVISDYTSVQGASNSLKSQEKQLEDSKKTVENAKVYIKAGRYAPSDLVQFKVDVSTQEVSVEQQRQTYELAILQLLSVLGLDPTTKISLPEKTEFPDQYIPTLTECIELALKNNVSYQQALINFRITQRQYTVSKNDQLWQLDLSLNQVQGAGSGGSPNSGLESITNGSNYATTAELQLTAPINNLTIQQTEVNAKVSLDQARIQLIFDKENITNETISAYDTVIIDKKLVSQAEEASKLSQQNLDIARAKLRYGRVSAFEVSQLQTDLINAQITYINSLTQYAQAIAALDQTLGTTLDRWRIGVKY